MKYTILDKSSRRCKKCLNYVYYEKNLVITDNEYPYYCKNCDENMYNFEVLENQQRIIGKLKGIRIKEIQKGNKYTMSIIYDRLRALRLQLAFIHIITKSQVL